MAHRDATTRSTWELNGEVGWYSGPAMTHYRCLECYFPRTRATRICDTVTFLPHDIPFPTLSVTEYLKQSADDIIHLLTLPPSPLVPTLTAGDPVRHALSEIATQLKRVEPMTTSPNITNNSEYSSTGESTPPRVEHSPPRVQQHAAPPRVNPTPPRVEQTPQLPPDLPTPASALQQPKHGPRNTRFQSQPTHSYNLRSKHHQTPVSQRPDS